MKNIIAILVFLISFSVYVYTLNPSISAADSNEIVTTAIVLGIPHQPSYPVNTILGHVFSKIPFGTLPWRVNLLSAVLHSLTTVVIYFVILRLYDHRFETDKPQIDTRLDSVEPRRTDITDTAPMVLAATATLFLAFSLEFWEFANRAEVFPLNNFFGASLILILISWWTKAHRYETDKSQIDTRLDSVEPRRTDNTDTAINNPSTSLRTGQQSTINNLAKSSRDVLQKYSSLAKHLPDEARVRFSAYQPRIRKFKKKLQSAPLGFLYLLAIVAGLAFTHHQTIIFIAPAFLFILLPLYKLWWKRDVVIKFFLCFVLGTLPYLSLIPMARANPPVMWGEPRDLVGVFKALTRSDYGTFSPYAQSPSETEGTKKREKPIDQTIQYFKSLNQDFTFLGLLLAGLGAYYLFKRKRQVFIFLFLGFFFLGPFFLGFGNWSLESGFHQAVAKRFQMLPNLFFTIFLAFGFFFLWDKFKSLNLDLRDRKNLLAGLLVLGGLAVTFIYPLSRNYKYANNNDNFLTFDYVRDSLSEVPKDAIVLISGDVTTFSFEYWETLVEPDNKRIMFSPGLLYMDWYTARLKKKHPDITIPEPKPGRLQASTTELVDANWHLGRPIYISPELARYDPEVGEKYVLWPRHLLFQVKKKGEDLKLEPFREENEAFWQSHDLPLMEKIRKNNPLLEYAMVPEYARHHFNTGSVFESVHLYDDAIREYERALAVHPAFPDPYKNLGRVYGFKLESKDRQKAWSYFQMFLQTALPGQAEDVEAVKGAMGMLQEEAMKEATGSGQPREASGSAQEASEAGKKR